MYNLIPSAFAAASSVYSAFMLITPATAALIGAAALTNAALYHYNHHVKVYEISHESTHGIPTIYTTFNGQKSSVLSKINAGIKATEGLKNNPTLESSFENDPQQYLQENDTSNPDWLGTVCTALHTLITGAVFCAFAAQPLWATALWLAATFAFSTMAAYCTKAEENGKDEEKEYAFKDRALAQACTSIFLAGTLFGLPAAIAALIIELPILAEAKRLTKSASVDSLTTISKAIHLTNEAFTYSSVSFADSVLNTLDAITDGKAQSVGVDR